MSRNRLFAVGILCLSLVAVAWTSIPAATSPSSDATSLVVTADVEPAAETSERPVRLASLNQTLTSSQECTAYLLKYCTLVYEDCLDDPDTSSSVCRAEYGDCVAPCNQ